MAKAKKQSESAHAPASKKAAPRKTAKAAGPGQHSMPHVDTNLAAEAAAKMIAQRAIEPPADAGAGAAPDPTRRESSAFKQMKQGLSKPGSQGLGNLLGNSQNQKKSHVPFGGGPQVRRNQTFGADVSRSSVPRRTGGG